MNFENVDLMTAMVTPFDDQQQIDDARLSSLIEHLLAHGTQGLIVGGTTGEAPTLSETEKLHLITKTAEIVAGRVPIVAGTGSNNTAATIDFTKKVSEIKGIDAALVVVPYYNKPNQAGMIAHFTAIADQGGLPVIIYNIPGRVVVKMAVNTVLELAKNPNIIGIKQCASMEEFGALVENAPADFLVYTGEDAQSLAAKEIGGAGVISVASHVYGDEMTAMFQAVATGDVATAAKYQRDLTPKMSALFSYPSPSPVKAALNHLGQPVGEPRLPILPLTVEQERQLYQTLNIK
ncbi:4-hydroxy-tetrahydrodipicolinate synthase [Lactobacillus sp.] [Lactiplantibacillus mudanjiangensis]|uniref:4-hydroxy-tetrahydrodipicolinate synthase n=1 Tax=Lactiplantibacillus mudanjiangensis TaxID=1296538 RepID=UPI0010158AE5|nr:4-hydroxy-tetrahydrodipicolinate synthase [Lactiplantibacillus mudanjiangensis]VDG20718.1 4-hydroxy-tetrahydrodipicolinate synthase [Lactobacillus sp.] [Lactiplantibacillus mudanjiangensis]VDG30604.1 4-hydroxy-tetrahydrodipicolinate synthase [Lactobacillus sp.] [Lactiplantibacillus mudanjiangensis]